MNGFLKTPISPTHWRSLRTLSITRVLLAATLLALLMLHSNKYTWSISSDLYSNLCWFYSVASICFVILRLRFKERFLWQLGGQVVLDVIVIALLYHAAGVVNGSLVILFLFPLVSCAILAPLLWALFLTALVTFFLLFESTFVLLHSGSELALTSSGVYAGGFFAIVYLVNRLANRVIRQEELTRINGRNLRIQQEINKLVVADMDDGVIVVDAMSRVHASNAASKKILGASFIAGKTKLTDKPNLLPIAEAFFDWRHQAPTSFDFINTVTLTADDLTADTPFTNSVFVKGIRSDKVAHCRLRFVNVETEMDDDERYIIFIQDAFEVENQAQQLKLASMGRLTASIAHEVRNPLSSISYAASLLEEELDSPQSQRLIKIVNDNVVRLNQMIEDILRLSRKAQIHIEPFLLKPVLAEIIQEFEETHRLSQGVIQMAVPDDFKIKFDPLHLREVVVNLLSNATRYASGKLGSIELFVVVELTNQLELHVHDDGPGISAEVRAHLFEPFYTSSSQGTGLGLYLARELCLNNGALLDYEYRVAQFKNAPNKHVFTQEGSNNNTVSGRFVITFVKPQ